MRFQHQAIKCIIQDRKERCIELSVYGELVQILRIFRVSVTVCSELNCHVTRPFEVGIYRRVEIYKRPVFIPRFLTYSVSEVFRVFSYEQGRKSFLVYLKTYRTDEAFGFSKV